MRGQGRSSPEAVLEAYNRSLGKPSEDMPERLQAACKRIMSIRDFEPFFDFIDCELLGSFALVLIWLCAVPQMKPADLDYKLRQSTFNSLAKGYCFLSCRLYLLSLFEIVIVQLSQGASLRSRVGRVPLLLRQARRHPVLVQGRTVLPPPKRCTHVFASLLTLQTDFRSRLTFVILLA